jgi:hypothetical protein
MTPSFGYPWFFSVPPGKNLDGTLQYVAIASVRNQFRPRITCGTEIASLNIPILEHDNDCLLLTIKIEHRGRVGRTLLRNRKVMI